MIRIGCYTGRIYGTEYGTTNIEECCVLVQDSIKYDRKSIVSFLERCKSRCEGCHGCPESKRNLKRRV